MRNDTHTHIHTHTHGDLDTNEYQSTRAGGYETFATYSYMHTYKHSQPRMCVCVCVCVCTQIDEQEELLEEEEGEEFYCVACDKSFKSQKQLANHQR